MSARCGWFSGCAHPTLTVPTIDRNKLRDLVLAIDESGKILVAVSEYGYGNTAAVTLYKRLGFAVFSTDISYQLAA